MGSLTRKVGDFHFIFTPLQKLIFDEFSKEAALRKSFYFGGGTALSVFYLQHRYSEDVDFFCEKEIDPQIPIRFMAKISQKLRTSSKMTKKETVLLFELKKGNQSLKVDSESNRGGYGWLCNSQKQLKTVKK
jgi:predicted nucleotidyltransferase component of viral defense system